MSRLILATIAGMMAASHGAELIAVKPPKLGSRRPRKNHNYDPPPPYDPGSSKIELETIAAAKAKRERKAARRAGR